MYSLIKYVASEEMITFSVQRKQNSGHHKIIQLYHSVNTVALRHAQNITGRQLHPPIRLHGGVLNLLNTGTILSLARFDTLVTFAIQTVSLNKITKTDESYNGRIPDIPA
jgi:hypothetical protein